MARHSERAVEMDKETLWCFPTLAIAI